LRPSSIRAEDLRRALEPDGWLGHTAQPRFAAFAASPLELPVADLERFFASRGLCPGDARGDAGTWARELVTLDLRAIAHGLSLLQSREGERAAVRMLPSAARAALADDPPVLDHVGIEVFGRLEWYVDALTAWASRGPVRLSHHRILPSVQVRKALSYDPELSEVRIARVYLPIGEQTGNLEIFSTTQDWRYSVARQLSLHRERPRGGTDRLVEELKESFALPFEPVGHLALRVACWQTVESVHRILSDLVERETARRLYDEELSYNADDQSLNSKILTASGTLMGAPVFGRIVELISYGVIRDPRQRGWDRGLAADPGPRQVQLRRM